MESAAIEGEKACLDENENVSILNKDEHRQDIEMNAVKNNRSLSLDPTKSIDFDPIERRMSSIMSLGDMIGDTIVCESHGRIKNGKWQKIVNLLDLTLFQDPVYVNIVIGISFVIYSDNAFFTILPMYLFELGFDKVIQSIITYL